MSQRTKAPSDALSAALDRATQGDPRPLYDVLTRGSRLPGTTANTDLVEVFADLCAARGAAIDRVVAGMAALDADAAPGNTALEFLPMCGVAAAGARAARAARSGDGRARDAMLSALHDAAEDLRWRVRALVSRAVASVGAAEGPALLAHLEAAGWLDGYFHATAVLLALADPAWIGALPDAVPVLAVVDRAFALARDAPRAASRYPGFKALVEALGTVPAALTAKYGVAVLDMLERWASAKDPAMRAIVDTNLGAQRVKSRFASDVARVRSALGKTAPVPRDPTLVVEGTRKRGGGRRRR